MCLPSRILLYLHSENLNIPIVKSALEDFSKDLELITIVIQSLFIFFFKIFNANGVTWKLRCPPLNDRSKMGNV